MKLRICFLVSAIVLGFESYVLSQESETKQLKQSGMYLGINVGPANTRIMNKPTTSLSGLSQNRQSSFGGSLEFIYIFSQNLGFYSGLNMLSIKSELTLNSYNYIFNSIDTENDEFEYHIAASNIKESQKVNVIDIPFCIIVRLPIGNKAGLFIQPGLGIMIPINSTYNSEGNFTYKGYYHAYDILLENLPEYGFPTNRKINNGGELDLNSAGLNIICSTGIDFSISSKIMIALGGNFYKTLSDFSDYPANDQFLLSPEVDKINSFMGGSEKVKMESLGLSFSLRYRIN